METGAMNCRITIQERMEPVTNANGLQEETWSDHYLCWAYVNNLSGREYWAAHAVQAEDTVVFTLRYCKVAAAINTKDHRIVFEGAVYDILFVDHVRHEKDVIKIKARRHCGEVSG